MCVGCALGDGVRGKLIVDIDACGQIGGVCGDFCCVSERIDEGH